jgi:hypothetical protein
VVWKLGQDVLRALVVELLSDDALARRIREVIQRGYS